LQLEETTRPDLREATRNTIARALLQALRAASVIPKSCGATR
jgi:hypothetical protein